MLDRRALLCGAAGFAGTVALGGCGDDPHALTVFFQAAPEEARVRRRIIDEFRRARPDIPVRVQLSGPDPQQQILTYCAGGRCPDVLMTWESYARFAELGVLHDLGPLVRQDPGSAADLAAPLTETFRFRGGLYALPEQWAGVFLYYNTDLFAAAGRPAPPARWSDTWTFAEFLDTAQALTVRDRDGRTSQWGFADAWPVPRYSAAIFGMNNGGDWFTPPIGPTRTGIGEPRFAQGFQFYADLAVRHRVAPSVADAESQSAIDLFGSGQAAMVLTGHWMYSTFTAVPGLNFDVTVLPVGPHGSTAKSDIGTTGLGIAASSPRKEQAWEFVKFATGPIGQTLAAGSGLFVPAATTAVHSPEFAAAHRHIRNLEVLTGGPANSAHIPVSPAWARVDAAFRRASDRVLRGAADADWFADGPAQEIDGLLRDSA
ncbi:ABC transporter substrate-binding protein [Nocardia stercoris]|uniref:Sugar ABC transporter substrate-binding protein n=1 Tax=Nocardia stercoris TaxID=2483361 RepID=A0A3M2KZR7_9NOCA|nr:sugar ABC transporter substrate-binding protein [Nocardia stercoris]RMI30644.1 sugar ABC transporter substrate-binding protein [Nocardia stercoris]